MYFGNMHCVCPSKPVILTWIGSSSSPQTFRWSFIPSGRSMLSEICQTWKWEMLKHKYNININVVFNWYRSRNAVHTDHSFTGCGKYFFFFLADQKNAITISCIKPELTQQYPEGELQYRTLVKTGGSGCPQPLATPLPLATSGGGKQPGNFLSAEP